MAQDHSFDITSKANLQELKNAIQQAQKELLTRFDFKGSGASIVFDEVSSILKITADDHAQLKSLAEVFNNKLSKRGVSVRYFSWQPAENLPSGSVKQQASLQQGISSEKAKAILNTIKSMGLKVQPRIEGDAVRVSSKEIDALQAVIQALKQKDFGIPIQFENYR